MAAAAAEDSEDEQDRGYKKYVQLTPEQELRRM